MRHKTTDQIVAEHVAAAKALPVEVRRRFWTAMTKDHKNVGEARKIDDIDLMVAAQLVILCHQTVTYPMNPEDIK